ncbi:MAG: GNAT family N-acetyltransferase [Pelagibacterium sp. SCN 63-23]|nr:MAG: GNAT family N-acetyltransferase [Pelagibacterium sp. SCN 63-23]
MVSIVVDPFPTPEELDHLWRRAWGAPMAAQYERVLARGLTHVGARDADRLIGFVNVAWDGGVHAFILDTCVDPDYRRQGVGQLLVAAARAEAQSRGAAWLHVDYEQHLEGFYRACGFRPTRAGLIDLAIGR